MNNAQQILSALGYTEGSEPLVPLFDAINDSDSLTLIDITREQSRYEFSDGSAISLTWDGTCLYWEC